MLRGYCTMQAMGLLLTNRVKTSDAFIAVAAPAGISGNSYWLAGDVNAITFGGPAVFTTSQWYQVKTVTVTAIDDSIMQQGDHTSSIGHTISGDAGYAALTPGTLTATIHDNDCGAWGWLVGDFAGGGLEPDGRPIGDCSVDIEDVHILLSSGSSVRHHMKLDVLMQDSYLLCKHFYMV